MSFIRIGFCDLEAVVGQVRESEGESPALIELETLLRFAEANEEPIYLDAHDLSVIESYL